MSNKKPSLTVINHLSGKNRQLQALRKSGVLYRHVQRQLTKTENTENIPYEAPLNDLELPSTSEQSSSFDVEFLQEATPYYTEETLFLETQDYELNLSESEEEEDEAEKSDEGYNAVEIAELDSNTEPDFDQMNDEECMRYWAITEHATHKSIRRLLFILNAKTDLNLPKDPRTLLRTIRNRATVSNIGEGKLWYHGIRHTLTTELQKYSNVPQDLYFDINIDGLPLHKRSKTQFWPILLKVVGEPHLPVMIVGIYSGVSKPESNEPFLRPMVEEINSLRTSGLQLKDGMVNVYLRAIIADTPARAFVKGVQGHTGKHSCLKCCCVGESVAQRVVFLNANAERRTDHAFRNREYSLHQTGCTPLVDLIDFDIIQDIIVVDRLHQIDIGVTKKLLYIWFMGMLRGRKRWNREQRRIFQQRLHRQTFPDETDRKFRSLDELQFWKGSECKTFLHYAAPVVLRGLLTDVEYKHFMLYFCAVTIFSSTVYKELWNTARDMIKTFVETYAQVYDETGVPSNVHSLVHLHEEAVRFGPLDNYSTYAFERKLGDIKSGLIRSSYRCLEQAIRRILEIENFNFPRKRSQFTNPVYKKRGETVNVCLRQGFKLRNDGINDWFLSKNNAVFKFITVRNSSGQLRVVAKTFVKSV